MKFLSAIFDYISATRNISAIFKYIGATQNISAIFKIYRLTDKTDKTHKKVLQILVWSTFY